VNLQWALDRVRTRVREVLSERDVPAAVQAVLEEAHAILDEDITMCRTIGENGQEVLQSCHTVLTHCNAGGLATSGYGTALAPVYVAAEQGHAIHVYADETRPLLQGARITAFELQQVGVPVTVICDSMAAWTMKKGKVDVVIVGADRIAANGDTANKIGTYGLAIAAHHHNVPFYVAAPYSTFDYDLPTGTDIPIEERAPDEITCGFGRQTAPDNVDVYNPAFDVTPVELISGIITEKGVWYP
jgi:methylthioribose-1-phosphate isomerase